MFSDQQNVLIPWSAIQPTGNYTQGMASIQGADIAYTKSVGKFGLQVEIGLRALLCTKT